MNATTPPKRKSRFNMDRTVEDLVRRSDNTKVTFQQRYLYRESNPSVLLSIANRIIEKLKHMGIVDPEFKLPINGDVAYKLEQEHEERRRRNSQYGTVAYTRPMV